MMLYAPESYKQSHPIDRASVCNGCGSKGFGGWVVPDTLWGLDIEDCCDIHDWMYHEGKAITDKDEADRVFMNNMMRKIDAGKSWLQWLRRKRAAKYYYAVKHFGGAAFWDGKNG